MSKDKILKIAVYSATGLLIVIGTLSFTLNWVIDIKVASTLFAAAGIVVSHMLYVSGFVDDKRHTRKK